MDWTCSKSQLVYSVFLSAAVVQFRPAVWKWPQSWLALSLFIVCCQSATKNSLKTPNDLLLQCFSTSRHASLPGGEKIIFYLWSRLSSFFSRLSSPPPHLPPGSPKWRLWEAVQHLPQTAHHQNGVSHQSESAWPIKPSASLPHHSLSLSQTLLLVQVCLCRGEVSGCIENSGFYTNGLSRICNVTFL